MDKCGCSNIRCQTLALRHWHYVVLLVISCLLHQCHAQLPLTKVTCSKDDNTSNKLNLSPIARYLWPVYANSSLKYLINLCEGVDGLVLSGNCSSTENTDFTTAVCRIENNRTFTSLAKAEPSRYIVSPDPSTGNKWMVITGDMCPTAPSELNVRYSTFINFRCAHTLGSPELVHTDGCFTTLDWHSLVACKKSHEVVVGNEVPCYVYDDEGHKYDLSPLIKGSPLHSLHQDADEQPYLVTSEHISLYISVCHDMVVPGEGGSEPQQQQFASSYKLDSNNKPVHLTSARSPLTIGSHKHLHLTYVSSEVLDGCAQNLTTSITFICPRDSGSISSEPKLVSSDCSYQIEWVTDHACDQGYNEATRTCVMSESLHGGNIDLTPLANTSDLGYYPVHTEKYTYYISPCGPLPEQLQCGGSTEASVCQIGNGGDVSSGKVAGTWQNSKLRYADDKLMLIMAGGNTCGSNHLPRITYIHFVCNHSADVSGVSAPTFVSELNCTYIFEWHTKHACANHFTGSCSLTTRDTGRHVDLSVLHRGRGTRNWDVLDARSGVSRGSLYDINVCGPLLPSSLIDNTSCSSHANPVAPAGCHLEYRAETGHVAYHSLGRYASSPVEMDDGSIELVYVDGGACGEDGRSNITTRILFTCKPDAGLQSSPYLTDISPDGCRYEMSWATAAACPLTSQHARQQCSITHKGVTFDLSPLMKSSGGSYAVTSGDYTYHLNVCNVTQCAGRVGAAVCQVNDKTPGQHVYSLGEAQDYNVTYYAGVITLSYGNGSPYRDVNATPRRTRIVFVCDHNAGTGQPHPPTGQSVMHVGNSLNVFSHLLARI